MLQPKKIWESRSKTVAVYWIWYNLWVGAHYNRNVRIWSFCIIPTLAIIWIV